MKDTQTQPVQNTYFFPEYSLSVQASSLEEAEELVKEQIDKKG